MNKTLFWSMWCISCLLVIGFVNANSDKPLISIPNCFNVSIHSQLLSGNFTPIIFNGCSVLTSGIDWVCDCHNVGMFNLTLNNDNNMLNYNDWRYYTFTIDYNTYTLDHSFGDLIVQDYGDRAIIKGNGIEYQGQNVVEVHDIVYQDRVVYRDVVKEVPTYINTTVYIQNDTLINECHVYLNNSYKENNNLTSSINNDSNSIKGLKHLLVWVIGGGLFFVVITLLSILKKKC